ncbi:hypothetical protein [Oceaniradius stylonematis]|jgi:hypothetical protein|uniref:hypothetical protein n=1 Tax=Oceaniradius stylonematis TaxID=2184161 RepID=UPI003C7BA105
MLKTVETRMINFGTSAYMKVLALNPRPRDTEIRKRLKPSESGYDFHKAMRKISVGFASGKTDLSETMALLDAIKKPEERKSATHGANQLAKWLDGTPIEPVAGHERRVEGPDGNFTVRFTPDFRMKGAKRPVLVHIWNTKSVKLSAREAIGTLGLFEQEYSDFDLGVLCLRQSRLFVMEDATRAAELARLLARDIGKRIVRLSEGRGSDRGTDEKRIETG